MSTGKEQLEVDDEPVELEDDEAPAPIPEVAKTNLSKRLIIDNLLEERRLQKQLADYDFDL
ncbi:PA3496 family putative envelope integrity protein [Pseudomonas orientalis]|uniref:PA3496 family putative envelope integrity protein n=1 Tax=Pseudomonas orientalis TaxID=76758 RepID=UPI000F06C335